MVFCYLEGGEVGEGILADDREPVVVQVQLPGVHTQPHTLTQTGNDGKKPEERQKTCGLLDFWSV